MEFIIAAISLGFLGSFHCIGMCGPIALALPIGRRSKTGQLFSILIYNSGRTITYALFGLVSGLFGKMFFAAGWQQALSVGAGTVILLFTLLPDKINSRIPIVSGIVSFTARIKNSFAKLFSRTSNASVFSIGLLNGFLPCGLVYTAAAGATLTLSPWKGILFMLFFGLGTIPVMVSLTWFRNQISFSFRSRIRKTVPYLVSLMAVLLIVRGLNLGIPYVSPKVDAVHKTMGDCCKNEPANNCNNK